MQFILKSPLQETKNKNKTENQPPPPPTPQKINKETNKKDINAMQFNGNYTFKMCQMTRDLTVFLHCRVLSECVDKYLMNRSVCLKYVQTLS